MKTFLYLLILLLGAGSAYGQNTQLVYLKTDQGQVSHFFPASDSTYFRTLPTVATDATLLPEGAPYLLNSELSNSRFHVLYDDQLVPLGHFEIDSQSIRPLKKSDNQFLMYNNGSTYTGVVSFNSYPELMDNVPETIGVHYLLEYDADQNLLQMLFNCICPEHQGAAAAAYELYPNFRNHLPSSFGVNNTMAWMNDGTVITVPNIYNQIIINLEDEYFIEDGYKWGSIWVKLDPATGEYSATPMLSENGSSLTFSVDGSADGEHVYRTGLLKGNNVQISPDETIWSSLPDQDSLHYTFITKENAQGDNLWYTPLFSYNLTFPTDSSHMYLNQFRVNPVQELGADLYVSLYYRINVGHADDDLYFNDFMGDESIYSKPELFEPDPITPTYVAKSAREIIRINSSGEKVAKLIMPLRHPDPWDVSHAGWFFQEPKLFKVNDKLGWPHSYTSGSDTTIYVLKINADASTDSIGIDFPAGRGVYVLWLNENLDLVDHTLYAFSTPNNLTAGVSISNIRTINQDTLMVDGKITNNTITSLDPVGLADEVTYSPATSFVALYSIPDFLVSQNSPYSDARSLHLFPNPTNDVLFINSNFDSQVNYAIFDMAGREISHGNIPARENLTAIDVTTLEKGIYLMIIEDAGIRLATEKFVVN